MNSITQREIFIKTLELNYEIEPKKNSNNRKNSLYFYIINSVLVLILNHILALMLLVIYAFTKTLFGSQQVEVLLKEILKAKF